MLKLSLQNVKKVHLKAAFATHIIDHTSIQKLTTCACLWFATYSMVCEGRMKLALMLLHCEHTSNFSCCTHAHNWRLDVDCLLIQLFVCVATRKFLALMTISMRKWTI